MVPEEEVVEVDAEDADDLLDRAADVAEAAKKLAAATRAALEEDVDDEDEDEDDTAEA